MADNFTVLDSAGSTVTFRSTDVGAGVECAMSIPTNTLGTPMVGQATMATSIPVVVASDQSVINVLATTGANAIGTVSAFQLGAPWQVICTTGANAIGTVSAIQLNSPWGVNLTKINGTTVNIGQAIMATSFPVVIASDQSVITVLGTTGSNAIGTVSAFQLGAPWSVSLAGGTAALAGGTALVTLAGGTAQLAAGTNAIGTASVNLIQVSGSAVSLGQVTAASSIPVVLPSNQVVSALLQPGTNAVGTVTALQGSPPWQMSLTAIGGTAVVIGQGVMTASIPVVLASNQSNVTTVLGAAIPAGTNAIGTVSVTGAIPAGTNAIGTVSVTGAIPAGTNAIGTVSITNAIPAGTNAIGTVSCFQLSSPWGVNLTQVGGSAITFGSLTAASSIPVALPTNQIVSTSITNVGGAAVATGGLSGLLAVGGGTASGNAISGNPVAMGGRAQQAEQATAAAAAAMFISLDNVGKQIISPYANKDNFKSGALTVNSAATALVIASANATNRLYVTSLQLGNSSSAATRVTFNDVAVSVFMVPANSAQSITFPCPMVFTVGTAVVVTCSTAIASAFVCAQGYFGTP